MPTKGSRIKKIRQALGLQQEDFGEALGISRQFLSNIENDRKTLNVEKLGFLLETYNVNLNYLIGGVGEMFLKSGAAQFEDVKADILAEVKEMLQKEGIIKK